MAKDQTVPQETAPADQTPADNTAPNTDAPNTPAPTEPDKPTVTLESLDEFGQALVGKLSQHIDTLNAYNVEIKSASEDANTRTEGMYELLRTTPDTLPENFSDERITPELLQEYSDIVSREVTIAEIFKAAANDWAKNSESAITPEKLAEITAKRDALLNTVKKARNLLVDEVPGAEVLLPEIVGAGKSGTSTGTGRGAGGRKMRGFTVSVDGEVKTLPGKDKDGNTVAKSSFAAAATSLGIPTPDLQAEYFKAVGTDDVEKLPNEQEFSVNGADGKSHTVKAVKNAE